MVRLFENENGLNVRILRVMKPSTSKLSQHYEILGNTPLRLGRHSLISPYEIVEENVFN